MEHEQCYLNIQATISSKVMLANSANSAVQAEGQGLKLEANLLESLKIHEAAELTNLIM